ncbi:sodium:solute symporter family transporter [Ereboglobus luteus]|nr:sodium:proline symporter [Ereboglobus luteus]
MKGVAQFVSGGRMAGRYLLAVAKGEMQAGAVVFVAAWEVFAHAGFVPYWWGWITPPIYLVVGIFGFVIYRFRETRAMTLAQFFEMRYSRGFRRFSGILGFIAGILNFGIIPAVGSRFMVYFLQLPPELHLFGYVIPTYVPLMGCLIGVSLSLTLAGGLITLMVTDCLEGIFSQVMYLLIIVGVFCVVGWSQMSDVLGSRPAGYSMVDPFDAWQVQDFNLWYVLMGLFLGVYGTMAWQNAGSYNTAAATPHDARMAGLLGKWREAGKVVVIVLLGAAALAFLNHPDFASASVQAKETLDGIATPQLQKQMTIPVALSQMLPAGVKGALCAILLLGIFGGDSTHLHSWGSMLAQDVILPRMKRPPPPEKHIKLLRGCIVGVAVFAFLFGTFFTQTEYIVMWWQVTTAVYVGGAGAAIIGGLYWRRGTSAGAWTAMVTGSILSGGGILVYKIWGAGVFSSVLNYLLGAVGITGVPSFQLNGIQISMIAAITSITLYIVVSLCTCKAPYPLEKMLHRDVAAADKPKPGGWRKSLTLGKLIGFDDKFSKSDKWIAGGLFVWMAGWFLVMVIGTAWNLIGKSGAVSWIRPWPKDVWMGFWHITSIGLPLLITVTTAIWFTWGGFRDIRRLFKSLKTATVDDSDNGTVSK